MVEVEEVMRMFGGHSTPPGWWASEATVTVCGFRSGIKNRPRSTTSLELKKGNAVVRRARLTSYSFPPPPLLLRWRIADRQPLITPPPPTSHYIS